MNRLFRTGWFPLGFQVECNEDTRIAMGLFRTGWFPLGFQLFNLCVFLFLIIVGLAADTVDMSFANTLRNTNFANLVVWCYWWPFIVIGAIIFGRLWCTVCPVELATSLSAAGGLKRKAPRWLTSGWVVTVFYIVILFIGIHTLAIHRIPSRMALYLVSLFGIAILTGLIFEKNAFCAYVCPVGHLLGLYARIAPFGWGVRDKSVCRDCGDKSCISKKNQYHFQARSCGVNLVPQKLDDNTDCLLCGHCLKACNKYKQGNTNRPNPGWSLRPFAKDLFSLKPLTSAQAFFLLVVSGFVIYEILTEYSPSEALLLSLPGVTQNLFHLESGLATGLNKSIILFILLPSVIWFLPWVLCRLFNRELNVWTYFKTIGIAFIPIMASAHVIKAIVKSTSRIPYLATSLKDPVGVDTASVIIGKSLTLSYIPSWMTSAISGVTILLIFSGVALSMAVVDKLKKEKYSGNTAAGLLYLIPFIYGGIFVVTVISWRMNLFIY